MRCIICDKTDSWENVDRFRYKKEGMSICKGCGFISYPEKYKTKQEILDYYATDYRNAPNANSMATGLRKLQYHAAFLQPILKEFYDRKLRNPSVLEIGAAFGLFLHWFKNLRNEKAERLFDEPDLNGVELTKTFVRNAWHEYSLELKPDFDDSKAYDLIVSYKSAEHILDIDLEFDRYYKALKPDGYFYVSVPVWFEELNNFGQPGWSLEYYYSPDHVNTWSKKIFEYLLYSKGFDVKYQNHSIYDSTYMCVKRATVTTIEPPNEYAENMEKLSLIRKADEALQKGDYAEAVSLYPNFPTARRAQYEYKRAEYDKTGFAKIKEKLIDPWLALNPNSVDACFFAADLATRYRQFELAIEYYEKCLKMRPSCENTLSNLANVYRMLSKSTHDEKRRSELREMARAISRDQLTKFPTGILNFLTWVYNDNAIIPTPFE